LEYVAAVLRHSRPEFDTLPYSERVALLKEGCRRVNEVLESLRKWERFLEYGVPERDLRPKLEKAARDVRAAELRDIEGLSNPKIGER
jgi:Mn-dependent DtxR family transcriptional regulator